jgi:hypothetical protein
VRARTTFMSVTPGTPSRSSAAIAYARRFFDFLKLSPSVPVGRVAGVASLGRRPPCVFRRLDARSWAAFQFGRTTPFARTAPTQGG